MKQLVSLLWRILRWLWKLYGVVVAALKGWEVLASQFGGLPATS